jgi:hypothetical protein
MFPENKIKDCINKLGEIFKITPHLILTEGDATAHIFCELAKTSELTRLINAESGGKTNKMHCFIPFFDQDSKKLSFRPDIVFIKVENTDLTKGPTIHQSSKNYTVNKVEFLIELKLNKIHGKKLTLKNIQKDMIKLNMLCEKNHCKSLFVLFDKKNLFLDNELLTSNELLPLISEGHIEIFYFKTN